MVYLDRLTELAPDSLIAYVLFPGIRKGSSCSVSQAIVDLQTIQHVLSMFDFVLVVVLEVIQHSYIALEGLSATD